MAKKGMKRPNNNESYSTESNKKTQNRKNDPEPVPEIQGAANAANNQLTNQSK